MASDPSSERVLVVAPFGRDAAATVSVLSCGGVAAVACADLRHACEEALTGAGVLLVAEEALVEVHLDELSRLLDAQPPWSDIPIIALAHAREPRSGKVFRALQRFNVTLLERPLSVRTLTAAVQVALRARRRQYEVRSLLDQRNAALAREQHARAGAESASRAKDDFLAMLGHELRNPLSPIVTALHLLRLREPKGIDRETAIIERQVAHLERLIDDLLDVSRIAQGKIKLKQESLQVQDIVGRAVEMARPLFEQRRHRLDVSVPADLRVRGDATRLAQVIANLLTNAAKYTPSGGLVSITAAREGGEVAIRVADNGIGIASDMLPRVFDLFVQERQPSDRAAGGLGLGLSIVRNLVTLHGGRVEAESAGLDKGTALTVHLPALREEAPEAEVERPSPPPPSAKSSSRRILVVDDNEDAAEMLALALTSGGYMTHVSYSGPEALLAVDDFVPDLAVLDIGLPAMDGYELARRLRERLPDQRLHLVALTGYGQAEDVRRAREAGFDEHFVKPVDMRRLKTVVSSLLEAPHSTS